MTEMEQDYAGQFVEWSMSRFKGIEDITHEQMINMFWNEEYFDKCEMRYPETGLEMPHENEYFSDINVWTGGFDYPVRVAG